MGRIGGHVKSNPRPIYGHGAFDQSLAFGSVSVNLGDPPKYAPALLDLFNETSTNLHASVLVALSSVRSQSGASPRDVVDPAIICRAVSVS